MRESKDIVHILGYSQLLLGKGSGALSRVAANLHKALAEGARMAETRGGINKLPRRKPYAELAPAGVAASQGLAVEAITEAQMALGNGRLHEFAWEVQYALAIVRELAARGNVRLREPDDPALCRRAEEVSHGELPTSA